MAEDKDDEGGEELWTEEELKTPPRSIQETVKRQLAAIEAEREALRDDKADAGAKSKAPGGSRAGEPFTEDEMRKKLDKAD